MVRSIRRFVFVVLLIPFIGSSLVYADQDYRVITGDLAAITYVGDGLLKELMKRVNYTGEPIVYPWARTIKESQEKKTITFIMARVPYREKKYAWIGPIFKTGFVFVVPVSDIRVYTKLDDFKKLNVGANRSAPTVKRLRERGFTQIFEGNSEKVLANMLLHNRFDAWYSALLLVKYTMIDLDIPSSEVRVAFTDQEFEVYITASPDLSYVAEQWQNALDAMKADGTYLEHLKKLGLESIATE